MHGFIVVIAVFTSVASQEAEEPTYTASAQKYRADELIHRLGFVINWNLSIIILIKHDLAYCDGKHTGMNNSGLTQVICFWSNSAPMVMNMTPSGNSAKVNDRPNDSL